MQNTKAKGIILTTKDYKENDKIAQIFTLELGKISVKFVGVKKPKAKLKAVCQPFALCEYELFKLGDYYTVTSAKIIESFSTLWTNYELSKYAFLVLDIVKTYVIASKAEEDIFRLTESTLNLLNITDQYGAATVKYMLYFMTIMGQPAFINDIDFGNIKRLYLDTFEGVLTEEKISNTCISVDDNVTRELCVNLLEDRVESTNSNIQLIRLLAKVMKLKFDIELKTMESFV